MHIHLSLSLSISLSLYIYIYTHWYESCMVGWEGPSLCSTLDLELNDARAILAQGGRRGPLRGPSPAARARLRAIWRRRRPPPPRRAPGPPVSRRMGWSVRLPPRWRRTSPARPA